MITIYEKNEAGLVQTGDRSISAFPSGLIRIDQLFQGKTGEELTHRQILGYGLIMPGQTDSPAFDGIYIFPEVQESKDGTGFTKYQCSGYGRTTSNFREISRNQITIPIPQNGVSVIVYNIIGTIVKRRTEVLIIDDLNLDDSLLNPIFVSYLNFPLVEFQSVNEINATTRNPIVRQYQAFFNTENPELTSVTFYLQDPSVTITAQRNFGEFTEYEILLERKAIEAIEAIEVTE